MDWAVTVTAAMVAAAFAPGCGRSVNVPGWVLTATRPVPDSSRASASRGDRLPLTAAA